MNTLTHTYRFNKIAIFVLSLLFAFVLLGCDAPEDVEEVEQVPTAERVDFDDAEISDSDIRQGLESKVLMERGTSTIRFEPVVENGIVILNGEVPNLLAKDRIETIASNMKGVRSVVNDLTVVPSARSDAEVLNDVQTQLNSDPVTEKWEVFATIDNGHVTLTGIVESMQESRTAEQIVKRVDGVLDVTNNLVVNYPIERADAEIEEDIRRAFKWDVYLDDGLIDVEVNNGVVNLSGEVGSVAERNHAELLSWVTGVQSVVTTDLNVVWWKREDMMRPSWIVDQTEADKREAIERTFELDPYINAFDVNTTVEEGTAILTGTVPTVKAKRRAAQNAINTVGIWNVQNNLIVEPIQPYSDSAIRQAVTEALERDVLTDDDSINYEVEAGIVSLEGVVDSQFDRWHYEDVVANVPSVLAVENDLIIENQTVSYFPPDLYDWDPVESPTFEEPAEELTDQQLKAEIENELYWAPYVNEDMVAVAVEDGVVTLSGTVPTPYASRIAVESAYQMGAEDVVNDLVIEYVPPFYTPSVM